MARKVGIVGAGVTPFKGRWMEKTYYELAQMATMSAMQDAGLEPNDVDAVCYGMLAQMATMSAMQDAGLEPNDVDAVCYGIYNDIFQRTCIPEHPLQGIIGLQNKFGVRISNGGATGAYTMSAAHAYVAAERFNTVLVLGVEKSTDCFDFQSMSATPEVIKTIGWSGDSFFEQKIGWSASDSYAEVVLAYMDEHPGDLKPGVTAQISALLSQHVRTNPYAQRQFDQVTPEEVMNSRLVVYPFKELEICVYTEGAAALIFAEEETAKSHSFAGKNQKEMSRIMSDHLSSHRAYEMAGIDNPIKSIDVVELHDAFVHQLEISMVEFGFVSPGRADALVEDGIMTPGGKLLVNPCGGLIYCGHGLPGTSLLRESYGRLLFMVPVAPLPNTVCA